MRRRLKFYHAASLFPLSKQGRSPNKRLVRQRSPVLKSRASSGTKKQGNSMNDSKSAKSAFFAAALSGAAILAGCATQEPPKPVPEPAPAPAPVAAPAPAPAPVAKPEPK